jgi:2-haloacid dehalogenase
MANETVAFDVIGTLFGLDRVRARIVAAGAPEHALERWFAESLRDYFAISHSGGYEALGAVLESSLVRTLVSMDLDAGEEAVGRIMSSLKEMDLNDGAREAFQRFTDAGWRIVTLTNGSEELTRELLERARLDHHVSAVLSCDSIGISKPHPAVYALAKGNAPGELWMVAAHAWDIQGAARAGLRTAFVAPGDGAYLDVFPAPDIIAPDLVSAAAAVLAR